MELKDVIQDEIKLKLPVDEDPSKQFEKVDQLVNKFVKNAIAPLLYLSVANVGSSVAGYIEG